MARVEIDGLIARWSVKETDYQVDLSKLGFTAESNPVALFLAGAGMARISFEKDSGTKRDEAHRSKSSATMTADPVGYFTPAEREARKPAKSLYEVEAARRFSVMSRAVGDTSDPNHAKATARWRELGGTEKRSGEAFRDFRETYITATAKALQEAGWKPKAEF